MDTFFSELQRLLGNRVKENEPMKKYTNFRIGGAARWFAEVRTVDELKEVLGVAEKAEVPTAVFGGGSNILCSDSGFSGLLIKIGMREYKIQGNKIEAQAGVLSSALARATANAGLKGLAWAISLPGTVGGAVRGNAGCFGGEIKDHLVSVQVLRAGKVVELSKADLHFGYRTSAIKFSKDIVLSALFLLEEGNMDELKSELDDKLMRRKNSQPTDAGSAGCLFKNYYVHSDEELQRLEHKLDIPAEMRNSRLLSAGWLIDQLDLKGLQIGGAKISDKHANFVLNTGNATADDVMQLIALIKTRARNELGVSLEEEVQYIGFSNSN